MCVCILFSPHALRRNTFQKLRPNEWIWRRRCRHKPDCFASSLCSIISLATRCAMPGFRMHLRARGKVAQVFKILSDAPQHPVSNRELTPPAASCGVCSCLKHHSAESLGSRFGLECSRLSNASGRNYRRRFRRKHRGRRRFMKPAPGACKRESLL